MEFDLLLETATADMLLLDKKTGKKDRLGVISILEESSQSWAEFYKTPTHTHSHTLTHRHIYILHVK